MGVKLLLMEYGFGFADSAKGCIIRKFAQVPGEPFGHLVGPVNPSCFGEPLQQQSERFMTPSIACVAMMENFGTLPREVCRY